MKFEFEQNVDDVFDLTKDSLRSSKIIKYAGLGLLIFTLINMVPLLLKEGISLAPLLSWVIPIVILIVVWIVAFKFLLTRRMKDPGNKNVMLGKREIEFLNDEILVETPICKTVYKWSAITKLRQSKDSYFLYLGKSQALIIPKRILESEESKTKFENFVNEKISIV